MWVADTDADEWLSLEWAAPVEVREVRLTFDDDLDVELNTLHHHRSPDLIFPELARDYSIEVDTDGGTRELVRIEGNRRRHRIHRFEVPVYAIALRVRIHATNGDPYARVVSVRIY